MDFDSDELKKCRTNRIIRLQNMLDDQKKQISNNMKTGTQNFLTNKKYRQHRIVLEERVKMAQNFIKYVSGLFFSMISNYQFLLITTEIDLNDKVARFKKNVTVAWQKLTHNLEGLVQKKGGQKQMREEEDNDFENDEQEQSSNIRNHKSAPKSNRGKNFKTSNEATLCMMQWLLRHFDNPYPTSEQKIQMSLKGNIQVSKVNNWFINARERTVKTYLYRDS